MLRIPCPYCGVRDLEEFRYGGEASIVRPAEPEHVNDGEWADYLFYRDNLKGARMERWLHRHGCRMWFLVRRDTLSHEITEVRRIDEAGEGD